MYDCLPDLHVGGVRELWTLLGKTTVFSVRLPAAGFLLFCNLKEKRRFFFFVPPRDVFFRTNHYWVCRPPTTNPTSSSSNMHMQHCEANLQQFRPAFVDRCMIVDQTCMWGVRELWTLLGKTRFFRFARPRQAFCYFVI